MATTNTTRFSLTQWPSSTDDFSREQMNDDFATIGNDAAIFLSGTSPTPPTISDENTKAFYWDKTDGVLFYRGDTTGVDPSAWTQLHPVVPSAHFHADLQPLNSELTAVSVMSGSGFVTKTATNSYAARTIVVSGNGISVSNAAGAAGNPTISVNSTSEATASTVVYRDSNSQFKIGTPTDPAHVTTKSYVDTAVSGFTALSTNGMVIRTGALSYETRSIAVSGSGISVSNGTGVSGNPTISVNSTSDNTVNTIVLRNANGHFNISSPVDPAHAATKSYVDTADALKANSADVYSKADIHSAKLYQYANTGGGTGAPLPPTGTRTTPRIYVQSTDPGTVGAITGDIWFQI